MTKLLGCLFAIPIMILLGSGAGAASPRKSKARQNANGSWNLDLGKSQFGEGSPAKICPSHCLCEG